MEWLIGYDIETIAPTNTVRNIARPVVVVGGKNDRTVPVDDAQEPAPDTLSFLGKIAAGRRIEALAQAETMQVPPHLRTPRPCYVLQVTGDSMCEAGILDGDYVVIEHRNSARNGEIVVALIREEETTLKRIVQEPGRVILVPENDTLEPMTLAPDDVEIQDILVGQLRSYR